MKRAIAICAALVFWAALVASVDARPRPESAIRMTRESGDLESQWALDPQLRGMYEGAAVDTYCIVWYDFEVGNWQGWLREDETAQPDTFFHVDDFAGLNGGSFGGLVPIEGAKSMWCGARANPSDQYLCHFRRLPGYGNGWEQWLETVPFAFVGSVTLAYQIFYDCETDYDFVYVEYNAGGDDWREIARYTDDGETAAEHFVALTQARTKLRFRFASDGAWSDEDGLWNTDGACIVDSITVRDGGPLNNFENFESVPVGALSAGMWRATPEPGFSSHAGLRNNLLDYDPCGVNLGSQIVFFIGSPNPSAAYPGLFDTPFCLGGGGTEAPCQNESVASPIIDMTRYSTGRDETQDGLIPPADLPELGGCLLRFTVYRDLPLANLVFYQWEVRRINGTCPGGWDDTGGFVYYGPEKDYIFSTYNVSGIIAGNDPVQIRLGVIDMCDVWYLVQGNCAQHTPAPYFDNVRLYRYKTSGPQWYARDLDLFQDNFPGDEYLIESPVRADAANDINDNDDPVIRPGDSIVVDCSSPLGGGIAVDPTFGGPAVYLHMKATYTGPAPVKPDLCGPTLAGSISQPDTTIAFNYVSDDGVWTVIQCDTARTPAGLIEDKYMVDLNDALFTRGYLIEYYFTARDVAGDESALPRWARSGGPYFEWTCLPTLNSDILFVDDCTGRGSFAGTVENYWMTAFDAVIAEPNNRVDKYDVNGPSSGVSNGPGSRAGNVLLTNYYYVIVWDSGDLDDLTLGYGPPDSDKSGDCQMLVDWMNLSEHYCGLWICGDGVAADLDGSTEPAALALMNVWCGVDLAHDSYFDLSGGRLDGGVVNPLVTGDPAGGVFVHAGVPDQFYLWGGCPIINSFDVLEKTGGGEYALVYPDIEEMTRASGVRCYSTNAGGYGVRTMWFGFSFQAIRDDNWAAPIDRFHIVSDVIQWFQAGPVNPNVTDATAPKANRLAQNFPNPFNPSTTIRYDLRAKGLVTIKVFDVSGRLVRTLVDGVREAGGHSVVWDGWNDSGREAESGIYFCKMETAGFSAVKKLVLLR